VLKLSEGRLVLRLRASGTYRLAVRYSPYWRTSSGCVGRGRDGMTRLSATHSGVFTLDFDVDAQRALKALGGDTGSSCGRALST
jgi:hypothetical protein